MRLPRRTAPAITVFGYMEPNTECSKCKIAFYRKPSQLLNRKEIFCSNKCLRQKYSEQSSVVVKTCNECRCKVSVNSSRRRNSKTGLTFCSNLCKNRFISRRCRHKRKDGKNNPYSHRKRRVRLLEGSNKKCQCCEYAEDVRMLDIHHDNGNHHDNTWSNLRVVCVWCHQEHHRCGKRLITKPLVDVNGEFIRN